MAKQVSKPQGGSVDRRGTSTTTRVAIVVFIFFIVWVFMDSLHHWHLLRMLTGH